jgi:hypothetical protein
MDPIFEDFRNAHLNDDGYLLSLTLSPVAPNLQSDKLRPFYRSTNFANVKNDIRYQILYDNSSSLKLPADEGNAWVDVYCAYWKAVSEIVNAEAASGIRMKVYMHPLLLVSSVIPLPVILKHFI